MAMQLTIEGNLHLVHPSETWLIFWENPDILLPGLDLKIAWIDLSLKWSEYNGYFLFVIFFLIFLSTNFHVRYASL